MDDIPLSRRVGDVTIAPTPALWSALEGIGRAEGLSTEALCGMVLDRMRRRGDDDDLSAALVQALHRLVTAYRRRAAEESNRCLRVALEIVAGATTRQAPALSDQSGS